MNIFTSLSRLALLLDAHAITLPTSPAHSQGKGNRKAKHKQKVEAEGKHGRKTGGFPDGLEQYTGKKGRLPAGLQKKKDEEGHLTRGLEQGGKSLKTTGKAKKEQKSRND